MKRIALVIIFLGLFSLFLFTLSSAKIQDKRLALTQSSLNISNQLEGDNIKVVINFKDNKNKASNRKEIESIIDVKNIKHKFKDSISATITLEEFKELQKNSLIDIQPVPVRNLFLQDSVPLINATRTWNLTYNSINLTGIGQTICIIDTGVNYSHSNFGGCYGNNSASSNCKIIGGWDYCADDVNCSIEDSNPLDVNGHGTHVAGIAAANGSINGVAIGAKIIMIKASNSSGSFFDDDLRSAIDWCVDNSSKFNISVISMSLGGGEYESYCDYMDDPLNITLAINNAVAKNISVVVASGNDASYTTISSPACITNSTPVGSSTKSDLISTFSNTNSLLQLLAPGSSIVSTSKTGGSTTMSGTSMATPHVAGAIAIINEYLALNNKYKTPIQIESVLNQTGKQIIDLGYSNLSFSRINLYNAILLLSSYPRSSNNYTYGTLKKSNNFTSNITLSDDFGLSSAWIESNHSGAMSNYSYAASGTNSNLSKSFNINLTRGKILAYRWHFNNSMNNINSSDWNYITIQNTPPNNLNMGNQSAVMNSNFSINLSQYFSDADEDSLIFSNNSVQNLTISINQTTSLAIISCQVNFTGVSYIQFIANDSFNVTFSNNLSINVYRPSFNFSNFDGSTTNFSSLTNFVNISVIIEKNNTGIINFSLVSLNNESFDINSYVNISYNRIEINSTALPSLNTSAILTLYNISLIYPQIYKNGALCSDLCNQLSYINNTYIFNVSGFSVYTLNEASCSDGIQNGAETGADCGGSCSACSTPPSGGGGGGSSPALIITEKELEKGYSKEMQKGEVLKFNLNSETHNIKINNILNDSASISLYSTQLNLTLRVGEERKISLTNSNIYDLKIRFNSIKNSKANFTLFALNEEIDSKTEELKESNNNNPTLNDNQTTFDSNGENKDSSKDYILILSIIVIIVLFTIYEAIRSKRIPFI